MNDFELTIPNLYLQYQPFTVRTDNNLLTYILTTPNLDTLGHLWVAALAGYNMRLEYLKGSDNKVAYALSRALEKLEETVRELLYCAHIGHSPWAEADNINVIPEGELIDQEVIVRAAQIVKQHNKFRNLANSDWVEAQQSDPIIPHVIAWINCPKDDRRSLTEYLDGWGTLISDYDKHFYVAHQKDFVIHDNLLNVQVTPMNSIDSALVFVVPMGKWQTAIDVCDCSAGHQGWDRTLSLMKERFWWPGMSQALIKVVANCGWCIQYKAKGQLPPMQPIICTKQMELVHIDYIGMEVTIVAKEKLVVKNVLVVIDHFTRYVQAFVMKNHMMQMTA